MRTFVLTLLATCCTIWGVQAQTILSFQGEVTDMGNHHPIENHWVTLSINGHTVDSSQTDAHGIYHIDYHRHDTIGSYEISTYDCHHHQHSASGHFSTSDSVIINNFSICKPMDTCNYITVSGHITEDHGQTAMANHMVLITGSETGHDTFMTHTDTHGYYSLEICFPEGMGHLFVHTKCNDSLHKQSHGYNNHTSSVQADFDCMPSSQMMVISGTVSLDSGNFSGNTAMVYLIEYDSVHGILTSVDSVMTDNHGHYQFDSVDAGSYLVKAALTPSSSDYHHIMPTYYHHALHWANANEVNLSHHSARQIDIVMISGNNPGGPGFIGGSVHSGANKKPSDSDPVSGVLVFLLTEDGSPVAYTYSENDGSFAFDDIAYGTYQVYAEVINLPTNPAIVTINEDKPEAGDIMVIIESDGVTTNIRNIMDAPAPEIRIYPNPAAGHTRLQITLNTPENVNLRIYDLTGRVVAETGYELSQGKHAIEIPLEQYTSGLFILELTGENVQHREKLMLH